MVLSGPSGAMRLFLAVELPPELREDVARFTAPFQGLAPAVRWTQTENLHVTLRFLGSIEPARLEAVKAAARRAAGEIVPFDLELSGAGAFPDPARPQVLWLGFGRGREALGHAASLVRGELEAQRIETERRPFAAHLTVARIREAGPDARLAATAFLAAELPPMRPFPATHVTLFQSHLSDSGSRYEVLERYAFRV
ncbi:MAG TPA: RNA 2',3'-cyclic phosphodiesterase [Candidatus Eisenbacteria bacterium]|nr:RNA 2',3'-cyclic phosphodiesterase [Candidatus Eisenbacteria bacterium]